MMPHLLSMARKSGQQIRFRLIQRLGLWSNNKLDHIPHCLR